VDLTAQLLRSPANSGLSLKPVDLNSKIAGMSEMLNATLGGRYSRGRRWPWIFGLPWSIRPRLSWSS